eukprot:4223414-Pyramimonas_sp.AAC.1
MAQPTGDDYILDGRGRNLCVPLVRLGRRQRTHRAGGPRVSRGRSEGIHMRAELRPMYARR